MEHGTNLPALPKVLIVDDEPGIRKLLSDILSESYQTDTAGSTAQALARSAQNPPDIVISDIKMPGQDGLVLLEKMGRLFPKVPVILMTGHGDKSTVLQALRTDAFDYLEKPFLDEEVLNALKRAADHIRLERDLANTRALMVQSSKMAALCEMAAGVTHELNSLLGTIRMLSDQIECHALNGTLEKTLVSEMAQAITATVLKASRGIVCLRSFARDGSHDPAEPASIKRILEDTVGICREKLGRADVELSLNSVPEDLEVHCQALQISQALLNLLRNACDAVQLLPERWIKIEAKVVDTLLEISVTDSGPGIPERSRKKIFLPFQTTKEAGKGAGLGLCIAQGIIESHHGSLYVDPHCSNTRFVMRIPLTPPTAGETEEQGRNVA